jgi:hypothetical protein
VAEKTLQVAVTSADKNLVALSQPKFVGDSKPQPGTPAVVLLVRPQEAVQAVQALAQAFADFYGAVADFNRAQFRLYRALGRPAQCLAQDTPPLSAPNTLPLAPALSPEVEILPPLLPSPVATGKAG